MFHSKDFQGLVSVTMINEKPCHRNSKSRWKQQEAWTMQVWEMQGIGLLTQSELFFFLCCLSTKVSSTAVIWMLTFSRGSVSPRGCLAGRREKADKNTEQWKNHRWRKGWQSQETEALPAISLGTSDNCVLTWAFPCLHREMCAHFPFLHRGI